MRIHTIEIGNGIHSMIFMEYKDGERVVPGTTHLYVKETTITDTATAEQYLNEIIQKIAALCVAENVIYDYHHNHLFLFFDSQRSATIQVDIDTAIAALRV